MFISIIIATRNRGHAIVNCLDSIDLSLKQAAPVDAEIVIANNASTDNTVSIVEEWSKTCSYSVTLVTENNLGIGFARNCALREAKGDIFIVVDDDCCLDINHITNAIGHYKHDDNAVLRGGRVNLGNPKDFPISIQTYPEKIQWHKDVNDWTSLGGGVVPGCNLMFPREIFEDIGFYDTLLGCGGIPAGEDSDYIYRAYLSGFLIEYVPDVIVEHHHGRREDPDVRKLIKNYALGSGALLGKFLFRHPNLSRKLSFQTNPIQLKGQSDLAPMDNLKLNKLENIWYYAKGALLYYRSLLTKCNKAPFKNIVSFFSRYFDFKM